MKKKYVIEYLATLYWRRKMLESVIEWYESRLSPRELRKAERIRDTQGPKGVQ